MPAAFVMSKRNAFHRLPPEPGGIQAGGVLEQLIAQPRVNGERIARFQAAPLIA